MSEWITDRLPTRGDSFAGQVITWHYNGVMCLSGYKDVENGEPWQPIPKPAPYVKPISNKVPPPPFKEMVANSTIMIREGELP